MCVRFPSRFHSVIFLFRQHSSAADCQDRLDALTARIATLEEQANTYQADLNAAVAREQELERNLKTFRANLQHVDQWCSSCIEKLLTAGGDSRFDAGVADIGALEVYQDNFDAGYTSRVPKMQASVLELSDLCKLLSSGKHAEAGASAEALAALQERMAELSTAAAEYATGLGAARAREQALDDVLKAFRENAANVAQWQGATATMVGKNSWTQHGCGTAAIEDLVDEFNDDYTNQEAAMAAIIDTDLAAGCEQLAAGQHSSSDACAEQLAQIRELRESQAGECQAYANNLASAQEREAALQQKLKDFNACHSQVALWIDACKATITDDDFGKGVDMEAVEIRADAFGTDYEAQKPQMEEYLATMGQLAENLQEGKHVDADATTARMAAIRQRNADLESNAESFKFALDLARTRESALIKALKMFNTQYGRTNAWCESCAQIVATDSYAPGAGTDLRSVERAVDMYKFKYEAPSYSHRSKLKQLQKLSMQIDDGQHASSADVKARLEDLTQRMEALTAAAAQYDANLKAAIQRETEMEQMRKEFDHKADQLEAWTKAVQADIGTSKSGKRRRGSVLVTAAMMSSAASENGSAPSETPLSAPRVGNLVFNGIAPGVGYDEVDNKLNVHNTEYVAQVDSFAGMSSDLESLAERLNSGQHKDAAECAERQQALAYAFNELQSKATAYSTALESALAREANLNASLQHFHTKTASVEAWLDAIDGILAQEEKIGRRSSTDPNKMTLGLNELEASTALFDAEYGQNIERMQGAEMDALQEYCDALASGRHSRASEAADRFEGVGARVAALPERAEGYMTALADAIASAQDIIFRQKALATKCGEFEFACKQLSDKVTSPTAGLVFSMASAEEAIAKHREESSAALAAIVEQFAALQEAEAYLAVASPGSIDADNNVESLRNHLDGCTAASEARTTALQGLKQVEEDKEQLRQSFALLANEIRVYVDEKTLELGAHEGSLEEQLAALEGMQADYVGHEPKMAEAAAAAEAQDAAGVVVNPHTAESIETLRAAWAGLSGVYTKATETISAQILAEQTAGLTPEQIAEANEVFDEFDSDKNGDLNLQEFHDCCTSLGLVLEKDEAANKHAAMDTDGSGRIDRAEFLSFYADQLTHRCVVFCLGVCVCMCVCVAECLLSTTTLTPPVSPPRTPPACTCLCTATLATILWRPLRSSRVATANTLPPSSWPATSRTLTSTHTSWRPCPRRKTALATSTLRPSPSSCTRPALAMRRFRRRARRQGLPRASRASHARATSA